MQLQKEAEDLKKSKEEEMEESSESKENIAE